MKSEYITKSQAIALAESLRPIAGNGITDAFIKGIEGVEGWISVKDRRPERFIPVIAYHPDFGIFDAAYDGREFYSIGSPVPVTHWMPLPEPPKEG